MKIRCIIVDDEPLAREILERYITDCPLLELAGTCSSAFEAIEILGKNDIGLIFLDVNMPKLSGVGMIRTLENPPQVIFTTAYPEFAVEGFELDAADYLVKPFSFERFMKGVNKALRRIDLHEPPLREQEHQDNRMCLLIKADGRLYRLEYDTIIFLEAFGDYVRIHTTGKVITTHETLKNLENRLPPEIFLRVHRSFIVSLDKIQFIEGNRIRTGQEDIPVAGSFRDRLITELDRRSKQPGRPD
jgi:DNA-binding LytR/AlgR family response regulator